MNLITASLLGIVLSLALAVLGALVYSLPVMWLWNAVVPDVFGVKPLTWVEALYLSLLCPLLFRATTQSASAS